MPPSHRRRTRRPRTLLAASLVTALAAGAVTATLASATTAEPFSAPTMLSGILKNAAKPTYFGLTNAYSSTTAWSEEEATGAPATYPAPGQTGVITVGGTCVPRTQSATKSWIGGIPVGDGSDCVQFTSAVVSPGVYTFRVNQPGADIDGRYLGNGDGKLLDVLSDSPATLIKAVENPAVTVEATATVDDTNGDGRVDAGDSVSFTATVRNTGDVDLHDAALHDSLGTDPASAAFSLAAGDAATFVSAAPHVLTQGDIDNGSLTNSLSFVATTQADAAFTPAPTSVSTPLAPAAGAASSATTSSIGGSGALGDAIAYTTTVTNTGDVTLTDLALVASGGEAVSLDATALAPGESTTATSTHVITQADIDAGKVSTTVVGHAQAPSGAQVDFSSREVVDVIAQTESGRIDVSSDADTATEAGDRVTYTATVTNDGNTTLTDLEVFDSLGDEVTLDMTRLAPGAKATGTAVYTLTQQDVEHGSISNTLTGLATGASGVKILIPSHTLANELRQLPSGTVRLSSTSPASAAAGQQVLYTATVTNTGTVTLSHLHAAGTLSPDLRCEASRLAPHASTTCSGPYGVTAADAARGSFTNVVDVSAKTPSGGTVKLPSARMTSKAAVVAAPGAAAGPGAPVALAAPSGPAAGVLAFTGASGLLGGGAATAVLVLLGLAAGLLARRKRRLADEEPLRR